MKSLNILFFLFFSVSLFAQTTKDFTQTVTGFGTANGGQYEYKATLKYNIQKVGLGDIRFKVGLTNFQITGFEYQYENAAELLGVNFPIQIKSLGSGYSSRVFASTPGHAENFDVSLNRITTGGLDIYDLESDKLKSFNTAFDLMVSPENIKEIEVSLSDVKLTNEYFDELSTIRDLMDKKLRTTQQIEQLKEEIKELEEDPDSNKSGKLIELYTELSKLDSTTDYSSEIENLKGSDSGNGSGSSSSTRTTSNSTGRSTFDAIERGSVWQNRMRQMQLSDEERRQVAQMTTHLNSVDRFESYGMSRSDAQRFANYESNMRFQEKIITNAFQAAGNILIDGLNRREEAINANEDYIRRYKQSVEAAAQKLNRYSSDYLSNLNAQFEEKYGDLNDIDELKKAILEYIYAWNEFTFAHHIYDGDIYMDDDLIIKQLIREAYFEEDILHVVYTQEVKRSSRDKDDEYIGYNKRNTVLHYTPAPYIITGWFQMDAETGKKTFREGSKWQTSGGIESLPLSGLIPTEDFRNQLRNIPTKSYYKPNSPGYLGAYMYRGTVWALTQMHRLKTLIEKDKISEVDKDAFSKQVREQIVKYVNLEPNTPYLFKRKENLSGSDKEISIFVFNEDDYLIYTIPDPTIVKRLFKDELTINSRRTVSSEDRVVKHKTSDGSKAEEWFVQGNTFSNVYFGDDDLLWIGEQYTKFSDEVFYVYSKSRDGVIAELELKKEPSKDYLNPYVEVGKIRKLVDFDAITDMNLKRYMKMYGYEEKSGLPLFQLKLERINLSMLHPRIKADFVMADDGAKDSNSKQQYLYFERANYTTHYGTLEYHLNNYLPSSNFYGSQVDLTEELDEMTAGSYDMSSIFNSVVGSVEEVSSTKTSYYTSSDYRKIYEIIPDLLASFNNRYTNPETPDDDYNITYYESNGNLETKGILINYRKKGLWEYYSEDGRLYRTENYVFGKLDGQQKVFYKNGKVKEITTFSNNKKSGRYTEYYEDGQTKTIGEYENNMKQGPFVTYYENGKSHERGNFKDDKPDGKWTFYHPNGEIGQVKIWKEGLLMEVTNSYDGSGKVLDEKTLVEGNGIRNYYNEDGELIKSESYVNGKKIN